MALFRDLDDLPPAGVLSADSFAAETMVEMGSAAKVSRVKFGRGEIRVLNSSLSAMISQYFMELLPFSSPDEFPTPRNLSEYFSGLYVPRCCQRILGTAAA
jgi:hypothetical protein